MKQSGVFHVKEQFPGCDIVRTSTFKTMTPRDSYVHMARANHVLAHGFAASREKSAYLPAKDCFGCLSPHNIAA